MARNLQTIVASRCSRQRPVARHWLGLAVKNTQVTLATPCLRDYSQCTTTKTLSQKGRHFNRSWSRLLTSSVTPASESIFPNVAAAIGDTPLVDLTRFVYNSGVEGISAVNLYLCTSVA